LSKYGIEAETGKDPCLRLAAAAFILPAATASAARRLQRSLFNGHAGGNRDQHEVAETSPFRVTADASIVLRRAVPGPPWLAASNRNLHRVGKEPEQKLARVALANEVVEDLQIDRFEEALVEGACFLRGHTEIRGG